jgi:hypothetical protein
MVIARSTRTDYPLDIHIELRNIEKIDEAFLYICYPGNKCDNVGDVIQL